MRMRVASCLAGLCALALVGCGPDAPDLAPVEAAFAEGTAGLGGARVTNRLAETPFGRSVAQAIRNSPDLTRASAELRGAQAERKATEGAFLPEVSLGAEAGGRSVGSRTTSDATPFIRVSQLVYDGGVSRGEETAAYARVLEQRGARLETASAAALRAVETHADLMAARQMRDLAVSNLAVHRDVLSQIEERRRSGAGVQSEVLTAQSRLADAETRAVDARTRVERAEAQYVAIFGQPPGASLPAVIRAPDLPGDTDAIVGQSPRIRAMSARLAARRAELATAQARGLPQVEMGATGRRADGGEADLSLDLVLNYSFDSRGDRAAAIESAAADVSATEAEREALDREIRRALAFVQADARAGRARIGSARAATRANARNVEAVRDQFSVGRSQLLDLLDAQRDYVAAQRTLIEAEREDLLTGYAALALTGDILDAFGVSVLDVATVQ